MLHMSLKFMMYMKKSEQWVPGGAVLAVVPVDKGFWTGPAVVIFGAWLRGRSWDHRASD